MTNNIKKYAIDRKAQTIVNEILNFQSAVIREMKREHIAQYCDVKQISALAYCMMRDFLYFHSERTPESDNFLSLCVTSLGYELYRTQYDLSPEEAMKSKLAAKFVANYQEFLAQKWQRYHDLLTFTQMIERKYEDKQHGHIAFARMRYGSLFYGLYLPRIDKEAMSIFVEQFSHVLGPWDNAIRQFVVGSFERKKLEFRA